MNNPIPVRHAPIFVALLLVVGAAVAASPHFVKGPTASISDGDVTVSWKEAGLGDNVLIKYEASADGTALYQCVNHGNRCPAASNKQKVAGPVVAYTTLSSGKNGTITGSLVLEPPAATLNCPNGQDRQLVSVSYTDIALADLTNDVVASATPSSLSQSGYECP